jgi:hypothetical protein
LQLAFIREQLGTLTFSIGDSGNFTATGFGKSGPGGGGGRGGPPGQFAGGGGGGSFFRSRNENMLEKSLSLSLELYELLSSLEESCPNLLFLKKSFGSSMPTKSAVRMIRS